MLFFLTGDVQIGKTRWLQQLVDVVVAAGVAVAGVLAPGDWVPAAGDRADGNGFEKRGIDNVLLPSGERLPFARRRDLAQLEGSFDAASQSARAKLAWAIDDTAIARVNEHFRHLAEAVCDGGSARGEARGGARSEARGASGSSETTGARGRGAYRSCGPAATRAHQCVSPRTGGSARGACRRGGAAAESRMARSMPHCA